MNTINVKIKKLVPEAIIPKYAKSGDAGLDLTATSLKHDQDGNVVYGTGLAIEIPEGYVGLIFPRSSNAKKKLLLSNSVGVIDSGYRGEIMLKFKKTNDRDFDMKIYPVGERIAQIVILPYPSVEFEEVETLSETVRGQGGFGSTGVSEKQPEEGSLAALAKEKFPIGTKFICMNTSQVAVITTGIFDGHDAHTNELDKDGFLLTTNGWYHCVYSNGEWAEIL